MNRVIKVEVPGKREKSGERRYTEKTNWFPELAVVICSSSIYLYLKINNQLIKQVT